MARGCELNRTSRFYGRTHKQMLPKRPFIHSRGNLLARGRCRRGAVTVTQRRGGKKKKREREIAFVGPSFHPAANGDELETCSRHRPTQLAFVHTEIVQRPRRYCRGVVPQSRFDFVGRVDVTCVTSVFTRLERCRKKRREWGNGTAKCQDYTGGTTELQQISSSVLELSIL